MSCSHTSLLRVVTQKMQYGLYSCVMTNVQDVKHRFAIVTSIAKAVYELLTEKASQCTKQEQGQVRTESTHPQAKESIPDDDASVIRVSGFALHLVIEYRKKELLPKFQYKHTSERHQELKLLKRMIAADILFIPRVVAFQDRGNMNPAVLNFGRALFSSVKSSLNYNSYLKSGSEVFKKTKEHTLESSGLLKQVSRTFLTPVLKVLYWM